MKRTKAIIMMLCISAVGLATSCTKIDGNNIVGKWSLVSQTIERVDKARNASHTDRSVGSELTEFTRDGRFITYDINGDVAETVNYSINGNTMFFWGEGRQRVEFEIKKLTSKALTLYNEDIDGDLEVLTTINFEKLQGLN